MHLKFLFLVASFTAIFSSCSRRDHKNYELSHYKTKQRITFNISQFNPSIFVEKQNSSLTFDYSKFNPRSGIRNQEIRFGTISLTGTPDVNLNVCGPDENKRCNNAIIRSYTNITGPGLFNLKSLHSVPLLLEKTSSGQKLEIGFMRSNAVVLGSFPIPPEKRDISVDDFDNNPEFKFYANLTKSKPGTYSTQLVIELVVTE